MRVCGRLLILCVAAGLLVAARGPLQAQTEATPTVPAEGAADSVRWLADGPVHGDEDRLADPNPSRLFLTPTGRPLGRGAGYIANYMLFFPFAAYGITDRVSIAGGMPILPELTGEIFYLVPQVTVVARPRFNMSVGALSFFLTREVDSGSVGILYGVGTVGDRDRSLTAGAGWGFALASGAELGDEPVVVVGGELRAGERTKLITENWFAPTASSSAILTGGIRFFGERISADLGIGGGPGVGCCAPVANFVYNFGG